MSSKILESINEERNDVFVSIAKSIFQMEKKSCLDDDRSAIGCEGYSQVKFGGYEYQLKLDCWFKPNNWFDLTVLDMDDNLVFGTTVYL